MWLSGANDGHRRKTSTAAVSNVGNDTRPRCDNCLSYTAGLNHSFFTCSVR